MTRNKHEFLSFFSFVWKLMRFHCQSSLNHAWSTVFFFIFLYGWPGGDSFRREETMEALVSLSFCYTVLPSFSLLEPPEHIFSFLFIIKMCSRKVNCQVRTFSIIFSIGPDKLTDFLAVRREKRLPVENLLIIKWIFKPLKAFSLLDLLVGRSISRFRCFL